MSVTQINRQPAPTVMGMGEMPWQGKRWLRVRKRYSDGSVKEELREVPESDRPYFWIPSFGMISKDEMEYLALAHGEKEPSAEKLEYQDRNRRRKETLNERWRDLCDARGAEQKGQRHFAL